MLRQSPFGLHYFSHRCDPLPSTPKRVSTRQHLVRKHAEAPHIHCRRVRLPFEHLRGHIVESTSSGAGGFSGGATSTTQAHCRIPSALFAFVINAIARHVRVKLRARHDGRVVDHLHNRTGCHADIVTPSCSTPFGAEGTPPSYLLHILLHPFQVVFFQLGLRRFGIEFALFHIFSRVLLTHRDAKISQLDVTFGGEQHVFGLQIPVDDPFFVQVRHGEKELG
mmetsp:Transcript_28284/g.72149  ORF Transcript_28284/g.72149 Transcript_28284/m.72149 type:complete len:223 (+) Transcript_28284:362-1030(+)